MLLEVQQPSQIPVSHAPHVPRGASPTCCEDWTLCDVRSLLVIPSSVSFNPFSVLCQLRARACLGFSRNRDITLKLFMVVDTVPYILSLSSK